MQTYRRFLILTAALAAVSLVIPLPCAAQPPVQIDVGVLPGFSQSIAWAINGSGQVVGASFSSDFNTYQGFVWQNGVLTPLPYPQGSGSCFARDINTSGQIAGGCMITDTQIMQASVWQFVKGAWTATLLGVPAGYTQSAATLINDKGDVVGTAGTTNPLFDPSGVGVYWAPFAKRPAMTVLKDAEGRTVFPRQLNATGQVLGVVALATNQYELVIWKAGAVTDVGWYNPTWASMNNKGEVVGRGQTCDAESCPRTEDFLYLPASDYGMEQGGYLFSGILLYAINDNGIVVQVDSEGNLSLLDLASQNATFIQQLTATTKLESVVINASGAFAGNFVDNGWYSCFYAGVNSSVPWYYPLSSSPNDAFAYDLNDSGGMAGYVRSPAKATAWAVTVTPAPLIVVSAKSTRKTGVLTETVALKNTGTGTADNVVVNSVSLIPVDSSGAPAGDPVFSDSTPISVKSIRPGATQTFAARFTGASVPPGTYKMTVKMTCSLGAVEITTLPIAVN